MIIKFNKKEVDKIISNHIRMILIKVEKIKEIKYHDIISDGTLISVTIEEYNSVKKDIELKKEIENA